MVCLVTFLVLHFGVLNGSWGRELMNEEVTDETRDNGLMSWISIWRRCLAKLCKRRGTSTPTSQKKTISSR